MSNPYRLPAEDHTLCACKGPRWNVSFWRKLYVRIVRTTFNLRAQYEYQRAMNNYHRRLAEWKRQYAYKEAYLRNSGGTPIASYICPARRHTRPAPTRPPMPLPPPRRLNY